MKQTLFDFEAMRSVDIRTVDPKDLVDIKTVDIKPNLPFIDRAYDYLRQTGNAYCFLCEDVIVKISHSKTSTTMTDCVEEIIRPFV